MSLGFASGIRMSGAPAAAAAAAAAPAEVAPTPPAVMEFRVVKGAKILQSEQLLMMIQRFDWCSLAEIRRLWRTHMVDYCLNIVEEHAFAMNHTAARFLNTSNTLAKSITALLIIPELLDQAVLQGKVERRGPGSEKPIDFKATPGAVHFSTAERDYEPPDDDDDDGGSGGSGRGGGSSHKYVLMPLDEFEETYVLLAKSQRMTASLQAAVVDAKDQTRCAVCSTSPKETRLDPCGHACCCIGCASKLKKCPICRADITSRQRVFF